MKKVLLTLIAAATAFTAVYAQTPMNSGGFENWTSAGTYEEPDGWGTLNAVGQFFPGTPVTAEKTTDVHNGQFACKLTTKPATTDLAAFLGANYEYDTLAGVLFSGNILAGAAGVPYNQRPIGASFYIKYLPQNGDSGAVLIQLTKRIGNQTVLVGQAFGIANTTMSAYELVALPIQYQTNDVPDTLTVIAMSSAYGLKAISPTFFSIPIIAPQPNSAMYLDDFSLLTTGLNEQAAGKINFSLYPNPANSQLTLATTGHQFGDRPLTVEFYDMTGRKVSSTEIGSAIEKVDVSVMSSGMYIYSLKDGQTVLRTGKFSVTK